MPWVLATEMDGTHGFYHMLFKDKGHKVVLRLNVLERQPMPQPGPHPERHSDS